jgi:hypothetical protein
MAMKREETMDGERQKRLLRFLVDQLRGMTKEVSAYQAVFLELSAEDRAMHEAMLERHRHAGPVRERVEREFEGFDELIEQFPHGAADETLRRLFGSYKPGGRPN